MLRSTMMTDQPHPPLEATPMLAEVSLIPHLLNGDSMQQMILVQVNPGETFTIRTEDGHVQCITGPAHVPMVSPNGTMPPIFVPPGYVSQVVEENGMRKVVVLPHAAEFHPSMPPPLPVHHYLPPHPALLQQHPVYPPFIHQLPPPQVYSEQDVACHSASGPLWDERASKLQEQVRRRLNACGGNGVRINRSPPPCPLKPPPTPAHNGHSKSHATPAAASTPGPAKHSDRAKTSPPSDTKSTDPEAEMKTVFEFLSGVRKPTVCNVTCRSVVVSWTPPPAVQNGDNPSTPAPLPLSYELALSQGGSEGSYASIYHGKETSFTLEDLRPALGYHVRVCASHGSVKGHPSEPTSFTTASAPPDPPAPPRLIVRTKSSLVLQWKAPNENGSKITGYLLEYDEGRQSAFKEIYFGNAKQYKVIRLAPSTKYTFRMAASNAVGMSAYSEVLTCFTAGCAPPPPAPPRLASAGVSWITLEWSAPCGPTGDDSFTYTLEMEEEGTGYGFRPKHNGEELSCTLTSLRRSSSYRFRVLAANTEGRSQPSAPVEFSTTPDKPHAPGRPMVRGRVQPHCLHVAWDVPGDDGGSEVTRYTLEMRRNECGSQWEIVYGGPLREHVCDRLEPGTWYSLRVYCQSSGGQSQVSDSLSVQTAPVAPGPCQALRLAGSAMPREIPLTWDPPAQDGGAPVSQYAVEMSESALGQRCPLYQGTETNCTANQLLPGRSYCFWVKAANQAGWGPLAEMCEASTAPGPPEQCCPLVVTVKTATCVLVSWEVPACNGAEVTEFRLEWGPADGSLTLLYCGSSPSYEVRGLRPATAYCCRVQALNSAGAGPFGDIAMVTTPPSVPAAVRLVEVVGEEALPESLPGPTPSCLVLRWEEPICNGAEITGYNIDFGEQPPLSVGKVSYYVLENLHPDTTYRVRVQAFNSIGAGPFSAALKAKTRALPPAPPVLECAAAGPQSLKLKWGEGPGRALLSGATQYCLHMQANANRLVCIYCGPCHTFKVQRLSEATLYHFSIQAHNEAGAGPLSPLYSFSTARSPPPQPKAPKIEHPEWNQYEITWDALQPMKGDPMVYTLQLQRGREVEQLYRGPDTSYSWNGAVPGCEWRVRVCAGRRCPDGAELWGLYSPSAALPALGAAEGEVRSGVGVEGRPAKAGSITDEQFALLLLLGFATVAILFAVVIQYFVIK